LHGKEHAFHIGVEDGIVKFFRNFTQPAISGASSVGKNDVEAPFFLLDLNEGEFSARLRSMSVQA
jgi:hypothetical protein